MRLRAFLIGAALVLVACPEVQLPEEQPLDAGSLPPSPAEPPDAGAQAVEAPDAGEEVADAGVGAGQLEPLAPLPPVPEKPKKRVAAPKAPPRAPAPPADRTSQLAAAVRASAGALEACAKLPPPRSDTCACDLLCKLRFLAAPGDERPKTVEHPRVGDIGYELRVRPDGTVERCTLIVKTSERSLRCPE